MSFLRSLLCAGLLLLGPLAAVAAKPETKEKSPADAAYDAFAKLAGDRDAKIDAARLDRIRTDGFDFILAQPEHARVANVISTLVGVPGSLLKDKSQQALREWWTARLKYEIVNRRMTPGLTDEARAALASLEAAVAGADFRAAPSRQTLTEYREKIDKVAAQPGGARFLAGHERDYLQLLANGDPKQAIVQANALLAHADKRVAAVAREELNLIELRQAPFEPALPALEGAAPDPAKLRGKVVVFYFWQAGDAELAADLAVLRELQRNYKLALEIVTVCCDDEAARPQVAAAVKEKKIKFPVLFDGQGRAGPAIAKLNLKATGVACVLDKRGFLQETGLKASRLEGVVKRHAGIK